MVLSNAEKQRRWRERNVIVLTREADDIAEGLMDLEPDELREVVKKLRKVASYLDDHLRHPDRTPRQRAVALGRMGVGSLHGPLPKLAAIEAVDKPPPETSWRVEAVAKGGQRWRNGVTFGSREEAAAYVAAEYPRRDVPGYVTANILRSDDKPNAEMLRKRRDGPLYFGFTHGECVLQTWQKVT